MLTSLLWLVVTIIIVCAIFGLLILLVRKAPFIDPEIKTWIIYVLWAVMVIVIIIMLINLLQGGAPFRLGSGKLLGQLAMTLSA